MKLTKSSPNVLITGISGFAGSHLAEYLLALKSPKIRLSGTYFQQSLSNLNSSIMPKIDLYSCDITHLKNMEKVIQKTAPDIIFNLAGISFLPQAQIDKKNTYEVNALSAQYLIDGVLKHRPDARLVFISTSEVYGKAAPQEMPLKESRPLKPCNTYAASKAAMEMIVQSAVYADDLDAIILRPFNHIGSRQSDRFAIANFAKQIVRIKLGLQNPILKVGDVVPQRDFTDVRDMVKAYWLSAIRGTKGEIYNICSGKAHSIRRMIESLASLSNVKLKLVQDPDRVRKSDVPILVGNYDKLNEATNWKPSFLLEETLKDILTYWQDEASKIEKKIR